MATVRLEMDKDILMQRFRELRPQLNFGSEARVVDVRMEGGDGKPVFAVTLNYTLSDAEMMKIIGG